MAPTETEKPAHPEPSEDLRSRPLPLVEVRGPWFRVHQRQHEPIYFGRHRLHRFDDPDGRFGVLYVAESERGAFIETFGQNTGARFVTSTELARRALSRVQCSTPITVVDLDGPNLPRMGADATLFAGPHELAQRWSRAFFNHPRKPMGIRFRAKHDPSEFSLALFDRCQKLVTAGRPLPFTGPKGLQLAATLLDHYGFGLI